MATVLAASCYKDQDIGVGQEPCLTSSRFVLPYGYLTLQNVSYLTLPMCFLILPNSTPPYPTLPSPILPCPPLPYPPSPSLSYPTLSYPTLPHSTLPYLTSPDMPISCNLGRESNASLYTPRNPSWHLATTRRRVCARYRNSLSSSAASPRDHSSGDCVHAGIFKHSRSRFAKSATRKEQRKTRNAHTLTLRGRRADRASGKRRSSRIEFASGIPWDGDLVSPVFK